MAVSVSEIQSENGNGHGSSSNGNGEKKIKRSPNPYLKGVHQDMLHNQYIDDETGEPSLVFNHEFVLEKIKREYITPLNVDKEGWIELAEEAWNWFEQAAEREKVEGIKKLLDKYENDANAIALLEKEIKNRKSALR